MNSDLNFDVIVIGSGVGGATFSDYLTRDNPNIKVAILESGPNRSKNNFKQSELQATSMFYNNGAVFSKNLQIGVAAANTLGGSSAVYTGVSFRPPNDVLQNWRQQFGLDFLTDDYVKLSLDEIETDLSVHELPQNWDNENNQLFQKGASKLGLKAKRLKINTKNCQQTGTCNFGCPNGAKQGALEVQIPKLIERGVLFFCNTQAVTVEENLVNALVKDAPYNTTKNQLQSGSYQFKANKIILAAGVLNTPVLLLNSAKKLGLKNKNIGRYICLHPVFNINGIYKNAISNYTGFPKTVYIDNFSERDGFLLETSFYPPSITAKNHLGYGILHESFMNDYHKMMSILILVHDKANFKNRISINRVGKRILDYTVSNDCQKSLIKALKVATKIFFAADCEKALIPASKKVPLLKSDKNNIEDLISEEFLDLSKTPLSSAHPQGGARMGFDKNKAACDTFGKVYNTKSIYVCDASLFPTSVEVNPYETIMLLSKWVAENLLKS